MFGEELVGDVDLLVAGETELGGVSFAVDKSHGGVAVVAEAVTLRTFFFIHGMPTVLVRRRKNLWGYNQTNIGGLCLCKSERVLYRK